MMNNQALIVAKNRPIFGRSLKSCPVTANTCPKFADATIPVLCSTYGQSRRKNYNTKTPIGFEGIPDATTMMPLIRTIQKELI